MRLEPLTSRDGWFMPPPASLWRRTRGGTRLATGAHRGSGHRAVRRARRPQSSRWPCPRRCSDSCGRLRYENMTSSILRQCAPARVVEELGEGDDEEGEEGSHGAPLTSGRIVDGLIPRLISQDRISLRRAAER